MSTNQVLQPSVCKMCSHGIPLPARYQQLLVLGSGPQAIVDVHGEEGAAAVEDGSQRTHQRSQHHS